MSNDWMEVFAPSPAQRRLLVELLANELAGDLDVHVDPTRALVFEQLMSLGMVSRVRRWFVLTRTGRELAGHLADRMLGQSASLEGHA